MNATRNTTANSPNDSYPPKTRNWSALPYRTRTILNLNSTKSPYSHSQAWKEKGKIYVTIYASSKKIPDYKSYTPAKYKVTAQNLSSSSHFSSC